MPIRQSSKKSRATPHRIRWSDNRYKCGKYAKTYRHQEHSHYWRRPYYHWTACEFDYSGAQACKALREEGYKVILVNSNPATIMTDPETADVTFIEPITWKVVERIIEQERPDAILPTMGGQTALNCALDLYRNGVLEKYNVELIGASPEAIDKAEDRAKFKEAMTKIGLSSARSGIAHTLEEAWDVQKQLGFPVIIRPSFTLGGTGGGIAYNEEEFETICRRGLGGVSNQ